MNCHHNFCRPCLTAAIKKSKVAEVPCPMKIVKCGQELTDGEIQALLTPDDHKIFIEKCNKFLIQEFSGANTNNTSTVPELLSLENNEYVENRNVFTCGICLMDQGPGEGVVLKNCLHEYCKVCLARTIELSDELEVPCPFVAEDGSRCEGILQDRELRSLITTKTHADHLAKSLVRAEAVIKDSFHCLTPDCHGWAEAGDGAQTFVCPICAKKSCIKCKAIHEGKTCEQHFYDNNSDARKVRDDGLTEAQLEKLILQKKAMRCPGCGVIIQKTTGCNHMKCSRCSRDFQWQGLD